MKEKTRFNDGASQYVYKKKEVKSDSKQSSYTQSVWPLENCYVKNKARNGCDGRIMGKNINDNSGECV